MKITIEECAGQTETEVMIRCNRADEKIESLVAALGTLDQKCNGMKDGQTYVIALNEILYFDTVDKKVFIYTERDIFETGLKLYELEQRAGCRFFRAAKSLVVNIDKIKSLMPDFGGRIELTLINGERRIVSRQYAHQLKTILGI